MNMKICLIIVLNLVYLTKKENTKETKTSQNLGELHNNSSNNKKNNIFDSSYTVVQLDHPSFKIKRHDDIEDLLKFLDCVEVPEHSIEELNNCDFVTLDYNSLKELLEDKQDPKSIDDQATAIRDGTMKETNRENFNLKLNDNNEAKSVWNSLRAFINNYILNQIPVSYRKKYLRRLKSIEEACNVYDKNKLDLEEYIYIFNPIRDEEFTIKLGEMSSIVDSKSNFSRKSYVKFLEEFNLKVSSSSSYEKICTKLLNLGYNQKNIFFHYELTKLYKYVGNIPELLTLGGLYTTKSCWDIVLIFHLINIISETFKDNKILILFMISKTFEVFHLNHFDIFKITSFNLECCKNRHNLYYFTWEFNGQKRQDLERRKHNKLKCTSNDIKDLKIVFLLQLYQTRIFDNYYQINFENTKLLKEFINKVKKSEDCIGCLFNEYISIISKIIKQS